MASSLPPLAPLRKQRLLTEFSSIKRNPPQGVFMSLTPNDPALWTGVMFIRKGPYASAVLRFQISFPPSYPSLPPLITVATDIFHPLIAPLTTYMYTTDIQDSGTVSATDDERLPPGGFSLRHGYPAWFGRRRRAGRPGGTPVMPQTPVKSEGTTQQTTPESARSIASALGRGAPGLEFASTFDILRYMRSTFDDESVLDSLPLDAAGNPGAWHAWRAHRIEQGKLQADDKAADGADKSAGEWNWEGVWETRVKRGLENCLSEQMLYGNVTGDDLIHFLNLDNEQLEKIKTNIRRAVKPEQ